MKDILIILALTAIPTIVYKVFGWTFLAISWQPITILGTAPAFIVGFKNNASYGHELKKYLPENDIPITQISRMIEIDMRDILDEKELPEPIVAKNNILV